MFFLGFIDILYDNYRWLEINSTTTEIHRYNILKEENKITKTTTTSTKKADGGKGGGGGGGGGKLDKLPEYLRETVDWFMG